MGSNNIVKVQNLSHRYSVQWAIKDLNFDISEKGIYGLLGSNGAGKSTTMNIISGVLKQTHGKVIINGIDLSERPIEAKKHIGFLPQTPPLYKDSTVEEFLANCARLRMIPKKKIKEAVDEVMDKCSIIHFRKRLINNLSGGYQQRVGIAQAIIHKPSFIILDEPTNGLDPNQILEIRALIKEIAEDRAILLSTHILTEVHALCDIIIMVEHGKIVFEGATEEFDNYLVPNTIFVRFLEMPSIDTLKAIDGVTGVEELGGPNYRLKVSEMNGAVQRIIKKSMEKGWNLDEIRPEKSDLNEVFSALSNNKIK